MKSQFFQKAVLALIGLVIIFLGLNVGLGGIQTMGWQTPRDFVSVADPTAFGVQDSHIRFIGGVWFGVGVMFLIGGFALDKVRQTLIALCYIIAVSGLFRLSAMDFDVIFSAAIAPSFVLELIAFPLLARWLSKSATPT